MTSAHIGRPSATVGAMLAPPSLLPWLPRCCHHCHRRHCHCRCHGCRHLRRHQHRFSCYCYRFLVFCPHAASAFATVACPHRCRRWLSMPLPLSPRPQTAAPAPSAATAASVLPLFLPLLSLVMFKILLRQHNILNICDAVPCPLQLLPLFLPLSAAGSISIAIILY